AVRRRARARRRRRGPLGTQTVDRAVLASCLGDWLPIVAGHLSPALISPEGLHPAQALARRLMGELAILEIHLHPARESPDFALLVKDAAQLGEVLPALPD